MVAIGTLSPLRRTNSIAASNTRSRLAAASLRSWRAGGTRMRSQRSRGIETDGIVRNRSGRNRPKQSRGSTMSSLPDDDRKRALAVARPDDPGLLHLGVVGDNLHGVALRRADRRSLLAD